MEWNLSTGLTSCFSPPASPPISVCNCFPSYADDSVMRAVRTSTVIRESRKEKASIENCSCCKPVSGSPIVENCAGAIVVQMFNDKVRAHVLRSPTVQLTIEVYEHMVKVLQVSLKEVDLWCSVLPVLQQHWVQLEVLTYSILLSVQLCLCGW